jgi:hypothetical protein
MAKRLTMAEIDTILTLHKAGHSNREISALVGVNRETVGKYLARIKPPNQPNAPTGKRRADPGGCAGGANDGTKTKIRRGQGLQGVAGGNSAVGCQVAVHGANRQPCRRTAGERGSAAGIGRDRGGDVPQAQGRLWFPGQGVCDPAVR